MNASLARLVAGCALVALLGLALPSIAPPLLDAALRPAPAARPADEAAVSGPRRVTIDADTRGHFVTLAVIDGFEVKAIIDTGATTVALTEATARKIGIRLSPGSYTQPIATANGVVSSAPVTLSRVQVGNVSVVGVRAMVVPGDALGVNLLGMTFLRRLARFESTGDQLMLVQ
jgi:aspartyl protease family protein